MDEIIEATPPPPHSPSIDNHSHSAQSQQTQHVHPWSAKHDYSHDSRF